MIGAHAQGFILGAGQRDVILLSFGALTGYLWVSGFFFSLFGMAGHSHDCGGRGPGFALTAMLLPEGLQNIPRE